MRVIHLVRKPLTEPVVTSVLESGTAALHIEPCRIRTGQSVKADGSGRWPTNLILQHLPGCRCVGTRKVKASAPASGPTLWGESTSTSRGRFNGVAATPSYGGADGLETIEDWDCEAGCPIPDLGEGCSERKGAELARYFKQVVAQRV